MRHTTLVLIAILAIALLMPTIWAMGPYLVSTPKNLTVEPIKSKYLGDPWLSNQIAVVTTPSMAAFLGENWNPYNTSNGTIYAGDYAHIYPYGTVAEGTMLDVLTPEYDAALKNATTASIPVIVYAGNSIIPNPTKVPGSNKWIPHVVS